MEISQYCIWWSAINAERVSLAYGCGLCVYECLAGSSGAWGSAMPPTVVYLGLVHAPLGGVDPRGALPQHSSISGCANLATMLWHPRFSSGPVFSLLSSLSPAPGLPRWDRGERGSLVQLWEATHCHATQKNWQSWNRSLVLFVFKRGTENIFNVFNRFYNAWISKFKLGAYTSLLTGQVRTHTVFSRIFKCECEVKQQKMTALVFDLHVYLYSWAVSVIESGWKSSSTFLCILEKLTAPYVFFLS